MTKEEFAGDILDVLSDLEKNSSGEIYLAQNNADHPHNVILDGVFDLEDLAERLLKRHDLLSA